MRPVKKALRSLDAQDMGLSQEEQVAHVRRCLLQIGTHIDKCLAEYKDADKYKEWK